MYTKILGSVLILISSSLIGLYYSKSYIKRSNDLRTFKKALILLRGEINYSLSPMPEALENISKRFDHEIAEFFSSIAEELKLNSGKTLTEVWKKKAEEILKRTYLSSLDIKNIMLFSENIGYLDKETQNNNINMLIEQVNEEINITVENDNRYNKLYKSLGVLVGILIIILFI
jgi:stage III sporulation protein AB